MLKPFRRSNYICVQHDSFVEYGDHRGALVPLNYNTVMFWYHGTIKPQCSGTLQSKHHDILVPRSQNILALWYHATKTPRYSCTMQQKPHVILVPCNQNTFSLWYHGTKTPCHSNIKIPPDQHLSTCSPHSTAIRLYLQ